MNTVYVVIATLLAVASLLNVAFRVGASQTRTEDHLKAQDQEIATLRAQVTDLHALHIGTRDEGRSASGSQAPGEHRPA